MRHVTPVLAVPDTNQLLSTCRLASRVMAVFGVCVGLAVLIGGWACGSWTLLFVVSGYSAMRPNTALGLLLSLGLLLCGSALWLDNAGQAHGRRRLLVQACAGIAGLIGALTLLEYFSGRNLGIDGLMFHNAVMLIAPGRMAVMSAVSFVLLSGALFLSHNRRSYAGGQYLVIAACILSSFNLIGYFYGIRSFYGLAFTAGNTVMAIHTSLTFVALCAGVLLSRPDWGLMSAFTSPAPGGVMARRLLPAALLIPLATGWFEWQGQRNGLYDTAFGLALFTVVNAVVFTFLIWRSSQNLNRFDMARVRAEGDIQELADSMPQMVWMATPEGNLGYYNQYWYDYTGMSFEQAKSWGWQPALHPDDLQNCLDKWKQALATCQLYSAEFRLRRASDNAYRWHVGRARPIRDAQGAVVRWFGTCTDIEDYRQAESEIRILNAELEERVRKRTAELDQTVRQLARVNDELNVSSLRIEESNRELQDFASVASHEMQEPLRKVQAFGDRLKTVSRGAMDEQGKDYLDRMLKASKRMQSLIQDLLRFARVTSQAQAFLPVDLGQVTRDVLSDLEMRIAETNALVEVGDLPAIDCDAVQMRQLLQNLIGNALKFHQNGRPPAVRVYEEKTDFGGTADGMVRLIVEDNGIGFDEKYLDRIFMVFQRLHGRAEYEGTGIGLAICRKIAQRHGGDITAKSAPGQGASFLVALPVRHPN